ncbi:hypothetical protein TNCV_4672641 [Trichonephila clavipes]|nr:hypothetical protein TNCV_4672641 [Trichonephila clavipes]
MPTFSSPSTIRNLTTAHCFDMDAFTSSTTTFDLFPLPRTGFIIACHMQFTPRTSLYIHYRYAATAVIILTQLYVSTFQLSNPHIKLYLNIIKENVNWRVKVLIATATGGFSSSYGSLIP